MADPITAKCAVTAGCVTSGAALTEYFIGHLPWFIWGLAGAAAAHVWVVHSPPVPPLRAVLGVLFSAILSAGGTGFVAEKLGVIEMSTASAIAIGLGVTMRALVTGAGSMSWSDILWVARRTDRSGGGGERNG